MDQEEPELSGVQSFHLDWSLDQKALAANGLAFWHLVCTRSGTTNFEPDFSLLVLFGATRQFLPFAFKGYLEKLVSAKIAEIGFSRERFFEMGRDNFQFEHGLAIGDELFRETYFVHGFELASGGHSTVMVGLARVVSFEERQLADKEQFLKDICCWVGAMVEFYNYPAWDGGLMKQGYLVASMAEADIIGGYADYFNQTFTFILNQTFLDKVVLNSLPSLFNVFDQNISLACLNKPSATIYGEKIIDDYPGYSVKLKANNYYNSQAKLTASSDNTRLFIKKIRLPPTQIYDGRPTLLLND